MRRVTLENERLKEQLRRCGCGRRHNTYINTDLARLVHVLDENEKLRASLSTTKAALATTRETLADTVLRYRRVLEAAQQRIRELEGKSKAETLKAEIGSLDTEITMLRAALKKH